MFNVGVPVKDGIEPIGSGSTRPTLLCFSHLRWDFVFQRPQHLMSRFARSMDVVFWEEPIDIGRKETAFLKVRRCESHPGVRIATPHLPEGLDARRRDAALARLLDAHLSIYKGPLVAWYYTPMMLPFSRHLAPAAIVYDCMDELSKFRFAPEDLLDLEQELIDVADLVFTGGTSLFEAKKDRHSSVHCFSSSVDRPHFARARAVLDDPSDQAAIPRPRLGYYGVVDERLDTDLLRQVADLRPNWSFVIVGPVVKIGEDELPRAANIHYLGGKTYDQLPDYLAGWDIAMMPFAMNDSTQFISPTKTPEYLAGGKPVVSTPVKDVVRHYGHLQGVEIAHDCDGFVRACEKLLGLATGGDWLDEADLMLSATSWDIVQGRMESLVRGAIGEPSGRSPAAESALLVAAQ